MGVCMGDIHAEIIPKAARLLSDDVGKPSRRSPHVFDYNSVRFRTTGKNHQVWDEGRWNPITDYAFPAGFWDHLFLESIRQSRGK